MKLWLVIVLLCMPPLAWLWLHHGAAVQVWLGVVNLLAVCLYAHDKTAAQTRHMRTPELVLHALAACGGAPGAAWARHTFRHKTLKSHFDVSLVAGMLALWFVALT